MKGLQQAAIVLVASAGVAALGGCASTPTSSTPLYAAAYQSPDAIVCRRMVKTGSRIATRECRRRSEWAADTARGRAITRELQKQQRMLLHR